MRRKATRHGGVRIVCLVLGLIAGSVLQCPRALAQDGVAGSDPMVRSPRAAAPADTSKTQATPKIRIQSPLVTTPVTVIDPSGEFVYDLKQSDFEVLDNGIPQQIQRFDAATEPLAAVIVIQTSDSVAPLLEQVRPLAPVFSSLMLGPEGQAAVISFSDQVRVLQNFSGDSERLAATLKGLLGDGSQARLNDALARAIAMLRQRPKQERRVLVAFSNGFDKGSETQKDDVIRRAAASEVTIYGLGFSPAEALLKQKPADEPLSPLDSNVTRPLPPGVVPTATNSARVYSTPVPGVPILTAAGEVIRSELASSLLEYYAGYTGGVFYSHWSKNALENQLNRIATEIQSQYEIAYAPDTLRQTGFHRIEVRVKGSGMKVRARAGYFNEGGNL